jgi:hypothetical protein
LLAGLTSAANPATGVRLAGLDGRALDALPGPPGLRSVFVFVGVDCPIAARYAPELRRIQERFGRGARFWLVYADPADTPEAVRRHAEAYGAGYTAARDPRHELVKLAGASVTPEAAVFVSGADGPRLVYRGRIDDRNVDFGTTRPQPKNRDLEDVLLALESGKAAVLRTTPAIGCAIPPLE